jgi:hypothetical protein
VNFGAQKKLVWIFWGKDQPFYASRCFGSPSPLINIQFLMVIHRWLSLEIIYCYGDRFGCSNDHFESPNDQRTTLFRCPKVVTDLLTFQTCLLPAFNLVIALSENNNNTPLIHVSRQAVPTFRAFEFPITMREHLALVRPTLIRRSSATKPMVPPFVMLPLRFLDDLAAWVQI